MEQEEGKREVRTKKKATNSFKTYIHKVLKKLDSNAQISQDATGQLDEFAKIAARSLVKNARSTCVTSGKSTISPAELELAVHLYFHPEMATEALQFSQQAIERQSNQEETKNAKPIRRETQAGLLFSVSLAEKYIREFGASKLNVSKNSSLLLAASLEHAISKFLESARCIARQEKKIIITIRHVFLAECDPQLLHLAKNLRTEFVGGGVVPNVQGKTKTAAEIKKRQNSTSLLLRKLPFERGVRQLALEINEQFIGLKAVQFSGGVIETLQYFVEQHSTALCTVAVFLAAHAKRDGVNGSDVLLAWRLTSPKVPENELEIQHMGKNDIERLAHRGGMKRKGADMHNVLKRYMRSLVCSVIFNALHHVKYREAITIGIKDLKNGFKSLGVNFTTPL